MSDIKKITGVVEAVEFKQWPANNGRPASNTLSIKIDNKFFILKEKTSKGLEMKAWTKAKEIGSANMVGQSYELSFNEWTPQGKEYPNRYVIGIDSPPTQAPQGHQNEILNRIKSLELRVSVLEGKDTSTGNIPTPSGHEEFVAQKPTSDEILQNINF